MIAMPFELDRATRARGSHDATTRPLHAGLSPGPGGALVGRGPGAAAEGDEQTAALGLPYPGTVSGAAGAAGGAGADADRRLRAFKAGGAGPGLRARG